MERIEKIKQFLETDPNDCFLRHALALEYIKMGNDTAAKTLFEAVLAYDPGYVGSYYHLAKLLERNNEKAVAINWYRRGIAAAEKAGDRHALNELRAALEELDD